VSPEPPTPNVVVHKTNLKQKDIDQIKSGEKTIEGRINCGIFLRYKPGDQVRFSDKKAPEDGVLCTISAIRQYLSFEDLLQQEGFEKCLPDVGSLEDAVSFYNAIAGSVKKVAKYGVMAMELLKSPS